MKRTGYPLAAVCGMEKAKEAVTLALVNPHAGGVLVSGEKGTGKSTLMRGARELYNAPWIEIPVSVTEDRLFGSIDAEAAVKYGKRQLQPGLIDEANGGVVYLDDANLLRDDILSAVLRVEETGGYQLERDGLSEHRDTKYTVLAVMAPESGTLSSAALDRFGLFVSVEAETDEEARMEIVRRVTDFEKNGEIFRNNWAAETDRLAEKIAKARALLPEVEVSDAMIRLSSVYTIKANVAGHRADIYLMEAARAEARNSCCPTGCGSFRRNNSRNRNRTKQKNRKTHSRLRRRNGKSRMNCSPCRTRRNRKKPIRKPTKATRRNIRKTKP